MKHVTIYREPGRYGGWPANYGIWSWGDEIVVGFTAGYYKAQEHFHARDTERPFQTMQARSRDGGETWEVKPFPGRTPGNRALSADEHMAPALWVANALDGEHAPVESPGGFNFQHPDFALMCARTHLRAGARSWFYVSYDRCRSWGGPYWLPDFGQTGVAARTDYLIDSADTCTLFLTAAKPNGQEGRVFCARTTDHGKTFQFVSWVTPEPEGYTIMPASLRLGPKGSPGRILVAVRCKGTKEATGEPSYWIDLYASDDDGQSWEHLATPVPNAGHGGNPPTLTQLQDGRLCVTYGLRDAPYGMRAVFSRDGGATWSAPKVLRDGAGNHDIGYPRTVQRPDGTVVTVYYWNDDADGERYIAATLWR